MSIAIEFNNVSKQYRLGLVSTKTLSHDIDRWWKVNVMHKEDPYLKVGSVNDRSTKADSEYVWALKNIDFKVEQGDVVGIIGKNGAGKSTLLKLLSKVTAPTTGTIRAKGRIGSLLEVGTGFHPEMTGRENIFMNGAILGMTKQEIQKKLDEIIDFSGCERYIDTPVKRYSSGMMVRLGFAVAAHLDPEILVVDEVLAVGDAEFQKKAIGKMKDVSRGEGRTVLFVSHNMPAIKNLCNNCVWIDRGLVLKRDDTEAIVQEYLADCIPEVVDSFDLTDSQNFTGTGELRIGHVDIHSDGEMNGRVMNSKKALLTVEIRNPYHLNGAVELAGRFRTMDNQYVCYFGSRLKEKIYHIRPEDESIKVSVEFESLPLVANRYTLGFEIKFNGEIIYYIDRVAPFQVIDDDFFSCGIIDRNGVMLVKQDWK
ncbi:MAG: polysaccharide ABC transporter ATP-binding protein [Bacteroidales bacterium]|nr:polysaccharide ABC transporter ATP-binding protein [Bacteroidales bacterium]